MRPIFAWKLRSRSLMLGDRTLIMGVVNVTPDSFSDGGQFLEPDCAVAHGLQLLSDGADILDIGGESTRPGAKEFVGADEEKRRVLPVIKGILRAAPDAVISVDSYKADTAKSALDAGAEIVNDVSGGTWDKNMLSVLASTPCGCVLMHSRGRPEEWKGLPSLSPDAVVPLVTQELRHISQEALSAGIDGSRVVLDPGFGFGKRLDENLPLLAGLSALHRLGFPLLCGVSRKSFVGSGPPQDRLAGTVAAMTAAILQGVHVVRVHDVAAALQAARIADSVLGKRQSAGAIGTADKRS